MKFGRRLAPMHGWLAGLSAIAMVGATAARAQDREDALGDIIVTAQRIEGSLQKTPVSAALLSGDDLLARGLADPAALQGSLPAVQLQPVGDVLANIRGIGTFNLQPGADAAIAYNLDDVYIAHATGLVPLFFDVARIEALRGPQGTLYGRNTNAGAINIITNKPVLARFDASAQVQIGNYDLIASEAFVNLPLGEKIALRVSGATQKHDGYLRDGHNDADIYAGRARLLAKPDEATSLLLTVDYSKQAGRGAGGSTPCPPDFAVAGCGQYDWDAYAGNETPVPNDFRSVENIGIYGEMSHDFDWAMLTAIASWRKVDFASLTTTGDARIPFGDFGYAPSNVDRLFTGEMRLNSAAGAPVQWVVGAYYSRETLFNRIDRTFLANSFLGVSEVLDRYRARSRAIFGQATVPIAFGIRATGGLRYTSENKVASGAATSFFTTPPTTVAIGGREDRSRLTWKAGLEVDLGERSLGYASVSTGFKSGGVNQTPAGFGIPSVYGPEKILAYQTGIKTRFFDNRLQLNAETFYYRYEGFQELLNSVAPGYLAFYTVNSQRARAYGGEIELLVKPTRDDELQFALALLNTRFRRFDLTALGGPDFSGNRLRNALKLTLNAGYQHRFDLGRAGGIVPRIETYVSAGYFTDAGNSVAGRQKPLYPVQRKYRLRHLQWPLEPNRLDPQP